MSQCLNIYFLAEVIGEREHPDDDVDDLAWFAPDELPKEIALGHVRRILARSCGAGQLDPLGGEAG